MPRREKLHYAWVVAGVTFLTLLVAAGLRATPSVLIVPLETEFGWSRATISFAIGVNIFLYGLIGPFAAAAMDRFGLRRTMLGALACIAVGVILTPLMTRPWQLVLRWGGDRRNRERSNRTGPRRDRRRPLVFGAARARRRHPDREHRDRAAGLPAGPREPRPKLRLAHRVAHCRRGRVSAAPARCLADAGSARGSWPATLRSARG